MENRKVAIDRLLALLAFLFALAAIAVNPDGESFGSVVGPPATSLALAFVACIVLLARRRNPLAVMAVVVVARTIMASGVGAGDGDEFALMPAVIVALYTVARTGERRRSLTLAVAAAIVMSVAVSAAEADESFFQELIGEVAVGLLPVAVADAARSRADRLRDLIDSEAEVRVQAERLRIARDLHDVVAHGLSTIAVQSGVAAHLLDRNPQQARESLDIINATGKQSLEDLRVMVGVLRSTDEVPLIPTPADPNDLSTILDGAARAAVTVTTDVHGAFPPQTSDASVVAVHRILQEALTNVARHAPGASAHVRMVHGENGVELTVSNDGPVSPPVSVPSTGVGIVGMVERAESLGGHLRVETTDGGGFIVEATVPYSGRRT